MNEPKEKFKRKFYGNACEEYALKKYQNLGFKLLARNLHLKVAECDLVLEKSNHILLVEVRGKRNPRLRPSQFLSYMKLNRLKLSARILSARYKKSIQVELFEILGNFPNVQTTRFPIRFD